MTGRGRAMRLRQKLSERDLTILAMLAELRLMTGAQLRRLVYPGGQPITAARKTRAVIQKLDELGLVVRLSRRIGGIRSGSDGAVVGNSGLGMAVLNAGSHEPRPYRRVIQYKHPHQDHLLGTTELAVQLYEREHAGLCSVDELQAEPGCWRHFSGIGGERRTLKPDIFVRLTIAEYEQLAFVEIDQGTESPATLSRKLGVHIDYWRSGQEISARGVHPKVWWVVPDTARLKTIARAIQRIPTAAQELFAVVLADEAAEQLTQLPETGGSL